MADEIMISGGIPENVKSVSSLPVRSGGRMLDFVGEGGAYFDTIQAEIALFAVSAKCLLLEKECLPGAAVGTLPAADTLVEVDDEFYGWDHAFCCKCGYIILPLRESLELLTLP